MVTNVLRASLWVAWLPVVVVLAWIGVRGSAAQDPAWPEIELQQFSLGLSQPVHATGAGDGSGRLFIVERAGRVRVATSSGTVRATPFLDITDRVKNTGTEQGLLSVAFPADYTQSGLFYVNYTAEPDGRTIVSRFHVSGADPNLADASSEHLIFQTPQPFDNHNGGQIAFGPDGSLYIGMGDGGGAGDPSGNAQDPYPYLGKMLRIQVVAQPPDVQKLAKGLRNPWRFSFDSETGALYIADVGQDSVEEVNYVAPGTLFGTNFGWNVMEGSQCYPATASCSPANYTLPVAEYGHHLGCSVTGGFVYRGPRVPDLVGTYLYGDFCSGRIWGLRQDGGGWANQQLLDTDLSISSFGVGDSGDLYVVDMGGKVYRVQAKRPPVPTFAPTATPTATPTSTPSSTPVRALVPGVARD